MEESVVGSSLKDKSVAVFAEGEDFAIGRPGRSSEGSVRRADPLLLVNLAAGTSVVATQKSEVEQDIKVIAVNERGRIVRTGDELMPCNVLAVGFGGWQGDVAVAPGLMAKIGRTLSPT